MAKRILIVGGVAGGASCAARIRRLDDNAEIIIYGFKAKNLSGGLKAYNQMRSLMHPTTAVSAG